MGRHPRRRALRTTAEKSHYTLPALVLAPPPCRGNRPGIRLDTPRVPPDCTGGRAFRAATSLGEEEAPRAPLPSRSPRRPAGPGPAASGLPSGRRCRAAHPRRERTQGWPAATSVRLRDGLGRASEGAGPRRCLFLGPVGAARRGAGGRRQLPGSGGRRGAATVTAAARCRAEARARRGGAAAPGEAQGSRPPARPSVPGQIPGCRCASRQGRPLGRFGPGPRVPRARSPRVPAGLRGFDLPTLSPLEPRRPQI